MVFLQFGYAGMYLISVATLKQGMSHYVLVVYRNAIAAVVIFPFALWFERPVLDQNFYYMGAKNTNASFASALYNILPAMTFINAILLRMIGAIIIVIGLYSLIWGKSKDHLTEPSETGEKERALELPISATDAAKSNYADRATVVEIPSARNPSSI
ncbi:putative WAT1-related protein [Cocos nucifera]|nr:putative WAT1-related protein [Cocos nucifera]